MPRDRAGTAGAPTANDSTTVSLFHSDLIGITDPSRMLLAVPCKEKAK